MALQRRARMRTGSSLSSPPCPAASSACWSAPPPGQSSRVLPPVPFVGFLALLAFGYVAAFTVAGGQTIGKMVLSLRVIGDDGRPIDAAGGMLRALGCMLVPATLGLSYLPALFTSDHRAIHDRLAGTRVVQE